jgi:peptidoglycan/LPS O-acetylase OafA/YrhL
LRRIPELDGLRGLAALAVVLYHVFPWTWFFGWCGVELFFTLSGYLITTIILDGDRTAGFIGRFYWKRALRIMPLYFVTLSILLVLNSGRESTAGLGWHLFFLQNVPEYWRATPPEFLHCFQPSWSVAAEQQFYLCWPPLLLLLAPRAAIRATVVFLAACMSARLALPGSSMFLLFTRGDGIAVGCLLGLLLHRRESHARAFPTLLGVTAFGALYVVNYLNLHRGDPTPFPPHACFAGFSVFFAGLIGLAVTASGAPWLVTLRFPLIRGLGTISFAMYLFHLPILHYSPAWLSGLGLTGVAREAAIWTLIFGLPTCSWFLLERPLLRLRLARFSPTSSTHQPQPVAIAVQKIA